MKCDLVLAALERAPGLGSDSFYSEDTGYCCAIGWLLKDAGQSTQASSLTRSSFLKRYYRMKYTDIDAILRFNDAYPVRYDDYSGRKAAVIGYVKDQYCADQA